MNPVTFYEKVSEKYNSSDHENFYRTIARSLLSSLSQEVKVNTILEVGAGTGFSTVELKNRYPDAQIIAIEPSSSMLLKAKDKVSGIDWHDKFFADFSITKKPDLIYSSMACHWFRDKELDKLFKLASNSVLAVALPVNPKISTNFEKGNWLLRDAIFKLRPKNKWPKEMRSVNLFLSLLKPHFKEINVNDFEITESFDNIEAMLSTLYTRGVLMALFGDKTEEAKEYFQDIAVLDNERLFFKWHFKLIIAS